MSNMEIHKWLNNGPKNKNYTISERGDHVESKYIIKNKFWPFQNTEKGALNPKISQNWP